MVPMKIVSEPMGGTPSKHLKEKKHQAVPDKVRGAMFT